jgi:hypothetical protein
MTDPHPPDLSAAPAPDPAPAEPGRSPWSAPPSPAQDRLVERIASTVEESIRSAYADGYSKGWLDCHAGMSLRLAEMDRRIMNMSLDFAGEGARVAALIRQLDELAPQAAQSQRLADALLWAEGDVASLKREVAHLKRLAGLPEGM